MLVPTRFELSGVSRTTGLPDGSGAIDRPWSTRSWLGRSSLAVLLALVALLAPSGRAHAEDTGYIQVQCEPVVQIFLDGVLKAVTNRDQEGLIIEGVAVGTRVVKAVKPGFTPQEQRVSVSKGEVMVVKIAALRPKPVVEQSGEEQAAPIQLRVGSVLVKSLPVECNVDFERSDGSRGWNLVGQVDKTKAEAKVSQLEIGTYRVTATRSSGSLSATFDLAENDEVTVFFNFVGKTTEVTSVARRATEARIARLEALKAAGGMVIDLGDGVAMPMVEIKPGRFMMGSPASERDRQDNETQHSVTISKAFWLGQTEVTQAEWQAVMGTNPSAFKGDLNRPVETVSWDDAQEFCRRLSQKTGMTFRLPTETEWEYACRAGTTTAYSFGSDPARLVDYAWFDDNAGRSTHPVATKKPNAWGLHDMHGNVWEWCADWYGDYPSGAVTDPQGPRSGSDRVLRGGSWDNHSSFCRASVRDDVTPGDVNYGYFGFRVARTP